MCGNLTVQGLIIMTSQEFLQVYLPPAKDWTDTEITLTTSQLTRRIEDNTSETPDKITLIDQLRALGYKFEMHDGIMVWLIAKSQES